MAHNRGMLNFSVLVPQPYSSPVVPVRGRPFSLRFVSGPRCIPEVNRKLLERLALRPSVLLACRGEHLPAFISDLIATIRLAQLSGQKTQHHPSGKDQSEIPELIASDGRRPMWLIENQHFKVLDGNSQPGGGALRTSGGGAVGDIFNPNREHSSTRGPCSKRQVEQLGVKPRGSAGP